MRVQAVFGPPGTGKTHHLIDLAAGARGVFLSYSKAAATEAVDRIKSDTIRPSTIHSHVYGALRLHPASVVTPLKLKEFAAKSGFPMKAAGESEGENEIGDEYMAAYSYARNRMMSNMEAYEEQGCPGLRQEFEAFIEEYEDWKKAFGYVDFDDMLVNYLRKGIKGNFREVFLDEAQDCSPLQWSVMERICDQSREVTIAGDDDQAIFEWNGADPHGMVRFMERNKGEMTVLARSYRLPSKVLKLATKVIEQCNKRVPKHFTDRGEAGEVTAYRDAEFVSDRITDIAPDGALFLVRDRWRMDVVKKALNRELIPYDVFGGFSPWTGRLANAIRKGQQVSIPPAWAEFYRNADLTLPIKYTISTIHSAKGREHDTVIHDADLPGKAELAMSRNKDAEIRVQYVGVTRARRKLIICGSNQII